MVIDWLKSLIEDSIQEERIVTIPHSLSLKDQFDSLNAILPNKDKFSKERYKQIEKEYNEECDLPFGYEIVGVASANFLYKHEYFTVTFSESDLTIKFVESE